MDSRQVAQGIYQVIASTHKFLIAKNERYGNSATEPIRCFSKSAPDEQIFVRMDDKLSRIKNSTELRKNDVVDLMGYLVLLCVSKGWVDFNDLID